MVARVDRGCWGQPNLVEVHELVHTLGGVQPDAPNATRGSHCTDEHDRMCYTDAVGVTVRTVCTGTGRENRLDCNHDDYFSTNPPAGSWLATHWNTADSAFLSASGDPPANPSRRLHGVWRPSTGEWYIRNSTQGYPAWGVPGDIPVPGDYDGDGSQDIAVYRPANGTWYIRNSTQGYPTWGVLGDIPVPGDYDGNGSTDIAVYRPANGTWYVRNSTQGYPAWGVLGDIPVPGDYDGNGTTDIAVYRPANGTWYVRNSTQGYPAWGILGDIPVPGDYDGNGTTDIVVYRPLTGEWFLRNLSPNYAWWGITADQPIPLTWAIRGFFF
jgi:hypothetical protein